VGTGPQHTIIDAYIFYILIRDLLHSPALSVPVTHNMEDAHSSMLSEFCAITGLDDPAAAISILEATNWNLEEAVNLQFATGGDLTSVGPRAQPAGDAQQHLPEADQEVRAPMPVVRDRLYGDMGHAVPARGTR